MGKKKKQPTPEEVVRNLSPRVMSEWVKFAVDRGGVLADLGLELVPTKPGGVERWKATKAPEWFLNKPPAPQTKGRGPMPLEAIERHRQVFGTGSPYAQTVVEYGPERRTWDDYRA